MCEDFKNLLIKNLTNNHVYTGEENWEIVEKEGFGRCLVAKRDIEVDHLIFCDFPLLYGPRNNNYDKVILSRL